MAEEILVRDPLTKEMLDAGSELWDRLKSTGFLLKGLFWLYTQDGNDWRLVVVSPSVDSEGAKKVYERIWEAIYKGPSPIHGLELYQISAMSPHNDLLRAVTSRFPGRILLDWRFRREYVEGVYIEDSYIYFIDPNLQVQNGR
jgi:hypothetical protein